MISYNDIGGANMPKKAMEILTESMFYVLMSLTKGDRCGTDIADDVEKITGGRVIIGPATLYTLLGKFEKEKLIREVRIDGRKRTYCLTAKGRDAYYAELERLMLCVRNARETAGEEVDADE